MPPKSLLVLLVGSALALACGGKPAAPPAPSAPNALMWSSCGPTDGPAKTFIVEDGALRCSDQASYGTRAHYELELWSGTPLADVPLALRGTTGHAARCDAAGKCADLLNATFTFHVDGDGSTVGTFRYVEGGVEVARSFRASRCEVHVMCG